jgi:hypothetical protein
MNNYPFLREQTCKLAGVVLVWYSVYQLFGPLYLGLVAGVMFLLEYLYVVSLASYNARTLLTKNNDESKDQTLHG